MTYFSCTPQIYYLQHERMVIVIRIRLFNCPHLIYFRISAGNVRIQTAILNEFQTARILGLAVRILLPYLSPDDKDATIP